MKDRLGKFIAELPDLERETLNFRFIDGLSSEEIAQMLGSKKVFVSVIERGAIERLAEMTGANEEDIYSWLEWWGREEAKAIDLELTNSPQKRPSPDCPSLDRLYIAHVRWDWTEQERQHVRTCEYCRFIVGKIKKQLCHPSSAQLWKYVTKGELSEAERLDTRYHLEIAKCRRCNFVAEKVLMPLTLVVPSVEPLPLFMPKVELREEAELVKETPMLSVVEEATAVSFPVVSRSKTFTKLTITASPAPVALPVEGFAGEVEEEVKVEEGAFSAQLKREQRGWVARAEAVDVPIGSKALFLWLTTEGVEKIRREREAEFKPICPRRQT